MKRWLTLLAAFVFAVIAAGCGTKPAEETTSGEDEPADTWKSYNSEEGGFTVNVPKEPEYQTQEMDSEAGSLVIHMYMVEHGEMAYAVMYNDIPGDLPDVPGALASGRDGTLESAGEGAELLYEKDITIEGNPGLEFSIDVPQPSGVYTVRIFHANDRLYQVMAMYPTGVDGKEAVFKFLDSFELE